MVEDENFQREAFSGIYLTMLGIIQAAAFTLLLTDTLAYVQTTYIDSEIVTGHDLLGLVLTDLRLWRAFATLAAVIIVTLEYTYFVSVMYRPVRVSDILTLFFLGVAEFCVVSQVPVGLNWWITNVLYSLAGIFSYWNTTTYRFVDVFKGDKRRVQLSEWHYFRAIAVAISGGMFSAFAAYSLYTTNMPHIHQLGFTLVWLFGFGTVVFWNASVYIQGIGASKA